MPSTEVKRTLVKSPPELWTELSDPASLGRHLGELGEIRITRVEPESAVEWEADGAKGSVQLKASGWGTKVTLAMTRELPERLAEAEPAPVAETESESTQPVAVPGEAELASIEPSTEPAPETLETTSAEPETTTVQSEPSHVAEMEPEAALAEPDAETERPETEALDPEPRSIPRRGFFARLFRRRRAKTLANDSAPAPETLATSEAAAQLAAAESAGAEVAGAQAKTCAEPEPAASAPAETPPPAEPLHEPAAVEAMTAAAPTPDAETETVLASAETAAVDPVTPGFEPAEPSSDLAAELAAMEQAMLEQDTALLTAVLDRLGAAHHRPFSRG